jgi:hypothetical protein
MYTMVSVGLLVVPQAISSKLLKPCEPYISLRPRREHLEDIRAHFLQKPQSDFIKWHKCKEATMDKIALMKRLYHLRALYTGACKGVMWLAEVAPEALNSMDDDPATLLSRANVGTIQPGQLNQQVALAIASHQAISDKAKHILNESQFVYRVALFGAFINDVMDAVLAYKPDVFQSAMGAGEFEKAGITNQVKRIADRFGFPVGNVYELLARRNLFVHTNGVIDSRTLVQISGETLSLPV